jgi:hypothetical protein
VCIIDANIWFDHILAEAMLTIQNLEYNTIIKETRRKLLCKQQFNELFFMKKCWWNTKNKMVKITVKKLLTLFHC